MSGSVKTQGTKLFLIDTLSASVAALVAMECPTGITGLGGASDQLDDTCLDDTEDKSFLRGLGNPGTVTVPFNVKPQAISQQVLWEMKESGENFHWMIGLSDGIGVLPTIDANGEFEVPPTTRTFFKFEAYVADLNIDIATNTIVKGTLTLQRSGAVTPYWKV
jgi:hypothetical protein